MNIKNIIFDIGGVLADPKSGHWFITTNFWNIINKNWVDQEKLKNSLKKHLYLQTQVPKTELEEHTGVSCTLSCAGISYLRSQSMNLGVLWSI